jgi:matrix metalloproteinase-16 (membrane-inserted)
MSRQRPGIYSIILKYFILFLFFTTVKSSDDINITSYLEQFGYLESNGSLLTETSLTSASHTNEALIRFQEFYNLPTDGTLNQETLAFISKPRCGVKDNPTAYRVHYQKWNKTNLKWYFSLATDEMKELAQKAFDQWESVSNLKFEYNSIKTDILISFPNTLFQHNHNSRCQKGICSSSFDGKGNVLAHGFFPNNNECLGIHFDKSENWYFGKSSNTPDGQTNFYTVLLHEIGHTLGIEHSANNNSIMYAYYNGGIDKLTQDDIWAIQYLYGRPERLKYELIPTTTTTVKPTVGNSSSTHEPMVNLCDFNKEIDTFLIANHHMYIFYKKYVWLVNLKDMTYDKEPKLIKDYLYFLPDDFKEVSHIYQRPSGDVLIVVKNLYYLIDFPSFNVKSGYNGQSIENLGIPKGKRIDAIFRTYSGKTYIFYDKVLYIEFDECLFRSKKNGLISELFAGIPPNINRAFRYRNLYFFKDKMFYEFDDISNTLVKSDKFDLTVFGFKCGLIDQIIKLINRL